MKGTGTIIVFVRKSILFIVLILLCVMFVTPAAAQDNSQPGHVGYANSANLSPRDGNSVLGESLRDQFFGGVVSAGVGTRTDAGASVSGNITVSGIPGGATVRQVFAYWGVNYTSGAVGSITLAGNNVNGTLIGSSGDVCWGYGGTRSYRADVTSIVTGNGMYSVVTPDAPMGQFDHLGVSLVVLWEQVGAPYREVIIVDGAMSYPPSTTLSADFANVANYNNNNAAFHIMIGDGQNFGDGGLFYEGSLLGITTTNASAGPLWDNDIYDVTAITSNQPVIDVDLLAAGDCLLLVGGVLSYTRSDAPSQDTPTSTSTDTPTETPTDTPDVPTDTPTSTATDTDTPTSTATDTNTPTQVPACIVVSRTQISGTEGAGQTFIYNVRLSKPPAGNESVMIFPQFDATEITVSPAMRLLKLNTWNTGRNFTVTIIDDSELESNPHFTAITHFSTSSLPGSEWNGAVQCQTIGVAIHENDMPTETPSSTPTNTDTATSTDTATETPTDTPSSTPTDTATSTDTATATDTATDTPTDTPTDTATATDTATSTTPPLCQMIISPNGFTINEGSSQNINVRLNQAPLAGEEYTVTWSIEAAGIGQITMNPAQRKLDGGSWNTGKNFGINALADAVAEGTLVYRVDMFATSNFGNNCTPTHFLVTVNG